SNSDAECKKSRRKRGKGKKTHIGRQRKQPRSVKNVKEDLTDESQEAGSSAVTDSDSSLAFSEAGHVGCLKSVNEPHLCSDSDAIWETTASEQVNETDLEEVKTPKKKQVKKRRTLAYRRKYSRVQAAHTSDSDEEEALITCSSSFDSDDVSESESSGKGSTDETMPEKTTSPAHSSPDLRDSASKLQPTSSNVEPAYMSSKTNDPFMQQLSNYMKLLLPPEWTVDVSDEAIRIFLINDKDNAAVKINVTFNKKQNSVTAFIHGIPVPPGNKIFQAGCDTENIGSLADYLNVLVSRLTSSFVCAGIQSHKDFWTLDRGFPDFSGGFENPSFRSLSCSILTAGKKSDLCFECRALLRKFESEEKKREKEKIDPCSTRDRDLSKTGIKFKKDKYKKMAKKEKIRADRLQKRVESLKIKLDEVLKDELIGLLNGNQHKMSELQKTFWLAQMKAKNIDDKRGLRWDPMLIRLALHLHSLSPNAYEFLGDSKILSLPSKRRLFDYSHFIESKEGCQKELLLMMKKKAEACGNDDHFSYINLMFDEMHIKSGLVVNRSTGELVGFTKLSGIDEELAKIQTELKMKTYRPRLARKVLVYVAQGITNDICDVVAIFTTDDLSAYQLYDRSWDVISHLEEVGLKVLTLTADGASVNRKFFMMHKSLHGSTPFTYCTKNLASEDHRPLYFIIDPPHLLKTIRNALANSFSHRNSRQLWKNGEFLSWQVIEQVYEITKNLNNPGHKLKKAHIKLSSFSVMTVLYATQVLSNSVAQCIEELSGHPKMKKFDTRELVVFIRLINRFFDCLNTKTELSNDDATNLDKEPYTDPNDFRLSFLEIDVLNYFEEWKKEVSERPGVYTDSERSKMIISHQALGALQITIKSIVSSIRYMLDAGAPYVSSRVFNQDPAEQYFGKLRRKRGYGNNLLVKEVLDDRMNLLAQGHVATSAKKGNVQSEKRKELEVDSSPLPSRKVVRKSKE
ncbi:Transposable element P transposase, partial [Frankliniella fusca]